MMADQSAPVRIAVGSTNPTKRAAVEQAAARFIPAIVEAVDVPSGVPAQPWGDEETVEGAIQRAGRSREALDADYGVGIESGVAPGPAGRIYVVSWAAAVDRQGRVGLGSSERFPLPAELADALHHGGELGPLIDGLLGVPGLARLEGVVSLLTDGRRDRTEILTVAALHAFAALLEPWRSRLDHA